MKKTFTLSLATIVALGLMSFSVLYDAGEVDRTGGHGETDCTDCHSGTVNTGGGSIAITATPSIASGYTPGASYTINVIVTKSGQSIFGFDFEALKANNTDAGTLVTDIPSGGSQIMAGAVTNVVQSGGTPGAGTHTFSFHWTAPVIGTGTVKFYASGNAADGDGGTAGDFIYTTSVTVAEGSPPALSATIAGTNVTCNGACNGSATVTPSGGSGTYTYLWAPSGGSAATATGLCAGTTYTCIISGGGTVTKTISLTAPAVMSATASSTDVTCLGATNGSAIVTPSGGTSPYTYAWLPSGGTLATASNLAAGTYTCTITGSGSASCTTTKVVTINAPAALTATVSSTDVNCFGGATGTATVGTPTGGTAPYTYSWAPSGGTGPIATGLVAGSYTCTITGSGSASCSITKVATVAQPSAALSVSVTSTAVTTTGGSDGTATATVAGGTSPYGYAWVPSGSGNPATGLSGGSYTVTVTDNKGCTTTGAVIVNSPGAVFATITGTNVTCNGASNGSATVTASGGTGTFTYLWAPSGGTGATATGLAAGTYTCTVTSGATTTATITITEPPVMAAQSISTNVSCFGDSTGTATVFPIGGTSPYTYSWNTVPVQTTDIATGLAAGTYTCTITGSGSATCTTTNVVTITQPSTALSVVMSSTPETIAGNDGTATVTANGGTPPYAYSWTIGDSTQTITGLATGDYTVFVSDSLGCMIGDTILVDFSIGIAAKGVNSSIKVYPNPNKGDFSVEINTSTDASYTLNILNSLGQTIKTEKVELSIGKNLVPLTLDATLHGVFIVQVISNQGIMNIPITKLK